jgi:hypothetical protein
MKTAEITSLNRTPIIFGVLRSRFMLRGRADYLFRGLDSLLNQLSSADDEVSGENVGSGGGWVGV